MPRARVIAEHRAPDRPAIRIAQGDTVTPGDRDQDDATAQKDYDTRELDADTGEILTLHYELADGWWAENTQGASGWIPARAIETIE